MSNISRVHAVKLIALTAFAVIFIGIYIINGCGL